METNVLLSDYELERGKPMPSKNHSQLELRISALLLQYADQYTIMPELSLELTTGKATPDICIYPKLTFDWLNDEVRMTEPPITTIEIISPRQIIDDVTQKIIHVYFTAGVKSSWVVIPMFQTIHILTPDKQVSTFTSGTLHDPATGIELPVGEIFK